MSNKLYSAWHYLLHFFTARREGHGIHSPFAYRLCENVISSQEKFYDFEELGALRYALLQTEEQIEINELGAGSRTMRGQKRKIKDIAKHGISSKKQSEFLYRLINYLDLKTCIEIGTSIGLNALYMAAATPQGKVYTLEGNESLINTARKMAEDRQRNNIVFIPGNFDDTLDPLLNDVSTFDLAYIDGNHRKNATLQYFELLLRNIHPNSVIILDDIYWSPEMTEAWNKIKNNPAVKMSIDLFDMGLLFFKAEIKQKVELRIFYF